MKAVIFLLALHVFINPLQAQNSSDIEGTWKIMTVESDRIMIDVAKDTIIFKDVESEEGKATVMKSRDEAIKMYRSFEVKFNKDGSFELGFLGNQKGTYKFDGLTGLVTATGNDGEIEKFLLKDKILSLQWEEGETGSIKLYKISAN